ncbi:MAG: hypothetical protein K2P99_06985 [Burkholderiales bacterium]|nr:hypothetical protein [Burkholderiales bacterium]
MSKLIMLLIVSIIENACTTVPKYENTVINNIGVNESNSLYRYCTGESCVKASSLTSITAEDLKALEPDVAPIAVNNVDTNIIRPRVTMNKNGNRKKHTKHSKIKRKRKTTKRVKECYYVKPNDNLKGE